MLRTATVTELRAELSSFLESLKEGPLLVLSHSRPAAVVLEPEMYEALLEKIELLEDILDGRRVIAEYMEDTSVVVDAEEVFERFGH
ncbi:MAG: type II toxin-antitoxin system Phd/YefM family antitoxin [Anaerolineales bacterium]